MKSDTNASRRARSLAFSVSVKAFAETNGFRMLQLDGVATNPAVQFRVESFVPAEGFARSKASGIH